MALVVVGGHTRNIGKTTLATQVIAAFASMQWTAMKITQFGHGVCSANGEACDCADEEHPVAITEERDGLGGSDSARMLAAGAARVLWVRTRQGGLAEAMPRIRKEFAATAHTLVESNSILRFVQPDVYLAVLQPAVADFKPSALRYLDRASALFVPDGVDLSHAAWPGIAPALLRGKPVFPLYADGLDGAALAWLQGRLTAERPPMQGGPAEVHLQS